MTHEEAVKRAEEIMGANCFVECTDANIDVSVEGDPQTFYVGKMPVKAGLYIGFMGYTWEEALKAAEEHYATN